MLIQDTRTASIDPMFHDLDAKECLMLHSIFLRAKERVARLRMLGEMQGADCYDMWSELYDLHWAAFDACMRRLSRISVSYEFIHGLPDRGSWNREPSEGFL